MGSKNNKKESRKENGAFMNLTQIMSAQGLTVEEKEMLCKLITVWSAKLDRNNLRVRYYNMHNRLKDLKISIPPYLKDTEIAVGWAQKAVDTLAVRSRFDGFSFIDGENDLMDAIVRDNRLRLLYRQARKSELIHSVAFLTVSQGGEDEAPALINCYSALNAAALWDYRRKRIKCGMTIVDIKQDDPLTEPEPLQVNLYTDDYVLELYKRDNIWHSNRVEHKMGRPLIEPLVYSASIDRPFGKSRITRAVMTLVDSAVRTSLRSEVASEFFCAPQKYVLGADKDTFADTSKIDAYIGYILALTNNEDGETPTVGQFAQHSMEPHIAYMRSLAARFSGETNVPISELGVIHDNPSSAEAIYAAKESLVIEATDLNEDNGDALKTIGKMALAIAQNKTLSDLDENENSIQPHFMNPAMPSLVSQADAMVKAVSAAPWIANTNVFLEELGFDEATRRSMMNDKKRGEATDTVAMITQALSPQDKQTEPKSTFDSDIALDEQKENENRTRELEEINAAQRSAK